MLVCSLPDYADGTDTIQVLDVVDDIKNQGSCRQREADLLHYIMETMERNKITPPYRTTRKHASPNPADAHSWRRTRYTSQLGLSCACHISHPIHHQFTSRAYAV